MTAKELITKLEAIQMATQNEDIEVKFINMQSTNCEDFTINAVNVQDVREAYILIS